MGASPSASESPRAPTPLLVQASRPVEVLDEYTVGALLSVLTWWLDNGTPLPAREMAATFERLTAPALQAGLGIGTAAPIVEQPT